MPAKPIIAETTISINAPIERVWQIMTDVNAYPQWNPFVARVDAAGDVTKAGTAMKFTVQWHTGGSATSHEMVKEAKLPAMDSDGIKRAHWAYVFTGVLDTFGCVHAVRYQWLQENRDGLTEYTTQEIFTGLLKGFVPLAKVQHGFERQAKALKHFAEQQ